MAFTSPLPPQQRPRNAPAPQGIGAIQKMVAEASGDMWPWKHWRKNVTSTQFCPDERGWEKTGRSIGFPFGMVIFNTGEL